MVSTRLRATMTETEQPHHAADVNDASNASDATEQVAVRVLRMSASFQGIAYGCVAALAVFCATNWLVIKGGEEVGPHLSLLSQYFIGYRVTFVGSCIGAAYAFILGFAFGFGTAYVYNFSVSFRTKRESKD